MCTVFPLPPSPWPVRGVERQAVGNFPLGGLSGERQFLQHGVSYGMAARTAPREILSLRVFRCRAVFSNPNLNTELYTKSRTKCRLSHLLLKYVNEGTAQVIQPSNNPWTPSVPEVLPTCRAVLVASRTLSKLFACPKRCARVAIGSE